MLPDQIERALDIGERQDVDPNRSRTDDRLEDPGVDPGPDCRLRHLKHLGCLGNLRSSVPISEMAANGGQRSTALRILFVPREFLQSEEVIDDFRCGHRGKRKPSTFGNTLESAKY